MTLTYVDLGLEGTLAIPTFHLGGGATGRDGKGRAQGGQLSPMPPPLPSSAARAHHVFTVGM